MTCLCVRSVPSTNEGSEGQISLRRVHRIARSGTAGRCQLARVPRQSRAERGDGYEALALHRQGGEHTVLRRLVGAALRVAPVLASSDGYSVGQGSPCGQRNDTTLTSLVGRRKVTPCSQRGRGHPYSLRKVDGCSERAGGQCPSTTIAWRVGIGWARGRIPSPFPIGQPAFSSRVIGSAAHAGQPADASITDSATAARTALAGREFDRIGPPTFSAVAAS